MKRVILFQPSSIHMEVLRPQLDFLRGSYRVTVFTTKSVRESDAFQSFRNSDHIRFKTIKEFSAFPGGIYLTRLFRYLALITLLFIRAEYIVFNTLSKRDLLIGKYLKKKSSLLGIVHNVEKFSKREYSELLKNFKKLLLLSDEVCRYCRDNSVLNDNSDRLDWFIPLLVDLQKRAAEHPTDFIENTIRIGVIGSVSQDRRDYNALWTSLEKIIKDNPDRTLPFKVIIAGRMKEELLNTLNPLLLPYIEYSTSFLSFSEMNKQILSCHLLAYLIHKNMAFANDYNQTKITGTSTILKSIPKVPVSSDDFPVDQIYRDVVIPYSGCNPGELFRLISDMSLTLSDIEKREKLIDLSVYSFENQKKRYLSFFN